MKLMKASIISVYNNCVAADILMLTSLKRGFTGRRLSTPPITWRGAARRYISVSLKREFASENGTELNSTLPKMSPLNPQYKTKKQNVFQKIAAFVEKFKGVGGQL